MKTHERKLNIPMCAACILFCLTLISIHLTSGLFARYTASDRENDSARVAKFDISENGAYFSESLLIETTPGSVEREIVVINNSEVAVAYTVTIKNTTQNIPYSFSVAGSKPTANECSVTCYLNPNSKETVKIVADWAVEGALKYMGMVDLVEISINAEQID